MLGRLVTGLDGLVRETSSRPHDDFSNLIEIFVGVDVLLVLKRRHEPGSDLQPISTSSSVKVDKPELSHLADVAVGPKSHPATAALEFELQSLLVALEVEKCTLMGREYISSDQYFKRQFMDDTELVREKCSTKGHRKHCEASELKWFAIATNDLHTSRIPNRGLKR